MNENTSAGPAPDRTTSPFGPICPAAAVPIAPKIPAPITAPIASMIRSPAPITRLSACSPSGIRSAMGLRRNNWLMREGFYPESLARHGEQPAQRDVDPVDGIGGRDRQAAGRVEGGGG